VTKQIGVLIGVTFLPLMFLPASLANAQVSFAPVQKYPLKTAPHRAIIGDFNGDGKPDLAALSIYGGTVSILLNNGDGTFASPQNFPAIQPDPQGPTFFSGIALGDVNGDGKLDVIMSHTTDRNTGAGVINVLLGNGDGTLQGPTTTAIDSFAYNLFGVGDFNGDGKLDVLCGADDSTNTFSLLVLFLGNGIGGFTRASTSQPGYASAGVTAVIADVNHDGKLDVVLSRQTDPVIGFLGNGDGTFQPSFQVPAPTPAFFLSAGDFGHHGEPDLISTSFQQYQCVCPGFGVPPRWFATGPPGSATLLMAKGDGTFGGPGLISNADFLEPVAGDFDGDGNLDFAAAALAGPPPLAYSGSFTFFLGNGQGGFGAPVSSPLAATNIMLGEATNIAPGDLDGDGFSDLVQVASSSLQIALNTTATFSLSASAPGSPIQAGGMASYTVTVSQQHGFSNAVALSCSAPVSAGMHCSISPSSVTPGGTATLSISTMGASALLAEPANQSHSRLLFALWLPVGAIFFGGIRIRSKQCMSKSFLIVILGSVITTGLLVQVACGGGGATLKHNSNTAAGTYRITVTGTSGSIQHSTTTTLTVQ
jgi:hypothetical protein